MKITFDWLTKNCTRRGGYNRVQIEAVGLKWPPRHGWKNRIVGREITEQQQQLFESFSDGGIRRITGKDFKLSGDCAGCCPPWEVCSWPCPDAIYP